MREAGGLGTKGIAVLVACALASSIGVTTTASAAAPPPVVLEPAFGGSGVVERPGGVAPAGLTLVGATTSRVFAQQGPAEELSVVALRPDGTVDPSYGADGVCEPGLRGRALAPFEDGSALVAVGPWSYPWGLAKITAGCDLDLGFGTGGSIPTSSQVRLAATWPNGRFVTVNEHLGGSRHVESRRADGSLDPAFGEGGELYLDFSPSILVRDGDAVLVGVGILGRVELVRLLPDGSFDASFGTAGRKSITYGTGVWLIDAVAVPGGYALLAVRSVVDGEPETVIEVIRIDSAGALVPAYGDGGSVRIDNESLASPTDLVARPDGGVDVVGHRPRQPVGNDGWITRLDPHGHLVPGFGSAGTALVDLGAREYLVAAVPGNDGGLLVQVVTSAGDMVLRLDAAGRVGARTPTRAVPQRPIIVTAVRDGEDRLVVVGTGSLVTRILPDGRADPGFGVGGVAQPRATRASLEQWDEVVTHPAGGVVVAGTASGDLATPIVGRLKANGTPDPSFGPSGVRMLPVLASPFVGYAMRQLGGVAVLGDGRIVLAGAAASPGGGGDRAFIARLGVDGMLDPSFGTGGVVWLDTGGPTTMADLVQAGDRLVAVAGRVLSSAPPRFEAVLIPLAADGRPLAPIDTAVSSGPLPLVVGEPSGGVTLVTHNAGVGDHRVRIVRLGRNGAVDATMGSSTGAPIDYFGIAEAARLADGSLLLMDGERLFRVRADGVTDPAWSHQRLPASAGPPAGGFAMAVGPNHVTVVIGDGAADPVRVVRYRFVPGWLHLPGMERSPWAPLGGVLRSGAAVVSTQPEQREIYVRGGDDQVWFRRTGAGAHGWVPLGGITYDEPAVSYVNGTVHLVVRGVDGAAWTRSRSVYGGTTWTGWSSLGGRLRGAPSIAGVRVFVRGVDDQLWVRAVSGGDPWQPLGGVLTSSPAAVHGESAGWSVGVRGSDGALWTRTAATGWQSAGGRLVGAPALAARFETLDAFARGTDNALWANRREGGIWSGWVRLGGGLLGPPAVALERTAVATIAVVVLGADGQAWETQVLPVPSYGAPRT